MRTTLGACGGAAGPELRLPVAGALSALPRDGRGVVGLLYGGLGSSDGRGSGGGFGTISSTHDVQGFGCSFGG